jgi:hypothetical protein
LASAFFGLQRNFLDMKDCKTCNGKRPLFLYFLTTIVGKYIGNPDKVNGNSVTLKLWVIKGNRGGHPIFFPWFAIDGSITFFLLFDFDKSRFLGI